MKPASPVLQADSLPSEPPGKPIRSSYFPVFSPRSPPCKTDDYLKEHGIEPVRKPKKEKQEVTTEYDIFGYEEPTAKSGKKNRNDPFGGF